MLLLFRVKLILPLTSSLLLLTSYFLLLTLIYSSLAQSVERMTVNHDVAGSSPAGGAKKFQVYGLGIFLSKPQAWYIIRRKSVYHQRRLSAFASHHASACIFLRLDDIQHYVLMICNSFGIDDIHALRRDFMASCNFVL